MATAAGRNDVKTLPSANHRGMVLNEAAIEVARNSLAPGAPQPPPGAWRADVVRLLNDALATELVCVLRYKRHHFTAHGLASPRIAEEFMAHARKEAQHADRLAQRIVQLAARPTSLPTRSCAAAKRATTTRAS